MLPHSPPVLLTAEFDQPTNTLTLTYDRTLRPGAMTPGNLNSRFINVRRSNIAGGVIAGTTVTAPMANPGADLGPDVADYFATPPEIISTTGVAAPAFADFPLT